MSRLLCDGYKRAKASQLLFGSPSQQRTRLADRLGI
jgi:hypothetical protein